MNFSQTNKVVIAFSVKTFSENNKKVSDLVYHFFHGNLLVGIPAASSVS